MGNGEWGMGNGKWGNLKNNLKFRTVSIIYFIPYSLFPIPYSLFPIPHSLQKRGIKLILPLVNNWREFRGMDQYLTWYALNYHDDFYTNLRPHQAYKDWITHLLNHKNIYTGIVYKNDPTTLGKRGNSRKLSLIHQR